MSRAAHICSENSIKTNAARTARNSNMAFFFALLIWPPISHPDEPAGNEPKSYQIRPSHWVSRCGSIRMLPLNNRFKKTKAHMIVIAAHTLE